MTETDICLVGIAGGSCSGKTLLTAELVKSTPSDSLTTISFDEYFVGMKRLAGQVITDWESPTLYRQDDFVRDLEILKSGKPVEVECNSRESTALGISSRLIVPRRLTLIEGFLIFHDLRARDLFDLRIFLDVPEDEMVKRRLARTTGDDGWDGQDYIQNMLIPGYRKYVLPQREFADLVLDTTRQTSELLIEIKGVIYSRNNFD